MTIPNTTTAHIDFNEWLDQCPVEWLRIAVKDNFTDYRFTIPDIELVEDD